MLEAAEYPVVKEEVGDGVVGSLVVVCMVMLDKALVEVYQECNHLHNRVCWGYLVGNS